MKNSENEQWDEFLFKLTAKFKGSEVAVKANKGQLFEYLVEFILNNLFKNRNIVFTATKASHDGSKDFWSIDNYQKVWWAECKNYNNSIGLTPLAPTLLMAELYGVEHLLFFSYSKLNPNLRRKIGLYAEKHQKEVYIYDDYVLKQLVQEYSPSILDEWIWAHENPLKDNVKNEAVIHLFNEKNPLYFNEHSFTGFYKIEELHIGEVYNLNTLIINRSLSQVCEVVASIQSNEDLYYFEFLSQGDYKPSDTRKINFTIQPCQAVLGKFLVRLVKYKDGLRLPTIKVEVKYNGVITSTKKGSNEKFKCIPSIKEVFIGDHYENIVQSVTSKCMTKDNFSGFLVYGRSGTGKTRILEECYVNLIKQGYKVMNFTGFDVKNNWANVVREIVFHLFSIQDDLVLDIMCDSLTDDSVVIGDDIIKTKLLAFLRLLKHNELSKETLKPYYQLIFEKLRQDKYAIIMDNVQSYSAEIVEFFREMIEYYLNVNRKVPVCVLFSLNTDLIFNENFYSFLSNFIRLKNDTLNHNFLCEELRGFVRSEQAVVFLKTILRMNDFPLQLSLLEKVLKRTSLRPKYLEQMANYLLSGDFIRIENNISYIVDEVGFRQKLESTPTDYHILFEENYNLICSQYNIDKAAEKIMSLLHLFGELSVNHIQVFKIKKETLTILQKHGVLTNKGDSIYPIYVIEHDLTAACLRDRIYPNSIETAAQLILDTDNDTNNFFDNEQIEYILCRLVYRRMSYQELQIIIESEVLGRIPNRLQYGFYAHLLFNIVSFANRIPEYELILNSAVCCKYVRDHISETQASQLFDVAYKHIECLRLNEINAIREHYSFVIHMAENKVRIGEYKVAMKLYRNYLKKTSDLSKRGLNIEKDLNYAIAYIYNRIFVSGKHEGRRSIYLNYLNDSKEICLENNFYDIMFENYFDEANIYLEDGGDIDKAIDCLENGFTYFDKMDHKTKKQFKVNYYSKKLLLLCLTGQFDEAINESERALQFLEYNDDVNYHLFFKSRYIKYKIIAFLGLQSANIELDLALEEYSFVLRLLGGNRNLELTYYKAVYAYLINDSTTLAFYFKEAYNMISEKNHKEKRYALMLENLAVKYRQLNSDKHNSIEVNQRNSNTQLANAVLLFSVEEFSEFNTTYVCEAPIKVYNGNDGYFL